MHTGVGRCGLQWDGPSARVCPRLQDEGLARPPPVITGEAEAERGPFKTRGFYSGVNGNRRANIPLRSERGEDPVPTIIISVTNREHRELFHYIMRHYIVLEKTVFDDMRRIGKCISGNPPFFLQGFQPMFIMVRII